MSDDEDPPDSGPYCRHWVVYDFECDERCACCEHGCVDHSGGFDGATCDAPGCRCPGWCEMGSGLA